MVTSEGAHRSSGPFIQSVMSDQHESSPIKVHCTVDRSRIVEADGSFFCQKCQKRLHDASANDGAVSSEEMRCGFHRFVLVSSMATAIALAACESKGRQPDGPVLRSEQEFVGLLAREPEKPVVVDGKDKPIGTPPTAEHVPGDNQWLVISPFTGKLVDVIGIPPGSLVMDPDFSPEDKKYFRIPARKTLPVPPVLPTSPER